VPIPEQLIIGGWSDASLGGTFTSTDGCTRQTGSALILCDGMIEDIQSDLDTVLIVFVQCVANRLSQE
jgi:hypothetical protein